MYTFYTLFGIQRIRSPSKIITEFVSSHPFHVMEIVSTYDISAIAYVMSEAASVRNKATPTMQPTLGSSMDLDIFLLI